MSNPVQPFAAALSGQSSVVQDDTTIEGEVRTANSLNVHGYIDGVVRAGKLVIHPSGRVYGRVEVADAEIAGVVQGDISVRDLIRIRASGAVSGNVRYGQLAMEQGAELSADVRNVPPRLEGDFDITVKRGGRVCVTTQDLTALDPDDTDEALTFSVLAITGGAVALGNASDHAVDRFTLADIKAGNIFFVHDGSSERSASFAVSVSDAEGASSGAAQTVTVNIEG